MEYAVQSAMYINGSLRKDSTLYMQIYIGKENQSNIPLQDINLTDQLPFNP